MITLPLLAASMYAAYPARSKEEVRISLIYSNWSQYIQQAGTVTIYKERPQFLVYHDKSFHLMDIKQCQCHQVGFGTVDEILYRSNIYTHHCQASLAFDNHNVVDIVVKRSVHDALSSGCDSVLSPFTVSSLLQEDKKTKVIIEEQELFLFHVFLY